MISRTMLRPFGRRFFATRPYRGGLAGLWRALLFGCLSTLVITPPSFAEEAPTEAIAEEDVGQSFLPANAPWTGDLDGMRKRGQVRVLVPFSKTFYGIDQGGKQFGITYELGRAFEDWLNKKNKSAALRTSVVFIPVARDRLLTGLIDGIGDIAAGNLTITQKRSEIVRFGNPLIRNVREVLVTGPSAPPIASLDDLAGQDVHVRRSSSYFEHLQALNQSLASSGKQTIVLTNLDEELEDEDIMEMVNAGLLPWAVVDEYKATLWAHVFTNLTVRDDLAVNDSGEIAWAMRKDSHLLLKEVNAFTQEHKAGTTFGNILKKRYFGSDKFVRHSASEEELAKFRMLAELFRAYGKQYDFDWLLIAAQGYQESRLDQSARSARGAVGVMQLLPTTAADPSIGIYDIDTKVENNIHAGVKYLRRLSDIYLSDPALDDKNRTLMAFAAYNAGPGNLRKFRRLAQNSGLDSNVWFNNVEHAAAHIVGRETVQYVSNIYKYYVAYRLATERAERRAKAKQEFVPDAGATVQ
jgi:membrane-bound lytic murein transglycosylase MltF